MANLYKIEFDQVTDIIDVGGERIMGTFISLELWNGMIAAPETVLQGS